MPICEIHYPENLFTNTEIEKITERLTNILLEAEGFEINPISRSLCLINLIPSGSMVVGGKITEDGKVVIKIHVFAEAYSEEIKKDLFIKITKIFTETNSICKSLDGIIFGV
jgi:phenylpyruvate tautomerase PptA (4-oxalocrotonate tautomerase family)